MDYTTSHRIKSCWIKFHCCAFCSWPNVSWGPWRRTLRHCTHWVLVLVLFFLYCWDKKQKVYGWYNILLSMYKVLEFIKVADRFLVCNIIRNEPWGLQSLLIHSRFLSTAQSRWYLNLKIVSKCRFMHCWSNCWILKYAFRKFRDLV